MILLAGEWVPAWLYMSITFLVASLGVVGLGLWVLRGSERNRAAEIGISSPIHLSHPSRAQRRDDLVWSQPGSGSQGHMLLKDCSIWELRGWLNRTIHKS